MFYLGVLSGGSVVGQEARCQLSVIGGLVVVFLKEGRDVGWQTARGAFLWGQDPADKARASWRRENGIDAGCVADISAEAEGKGEWEDPTGHPIDAVDGTGLTARISSWADTGGKN